MWDLTNRGIIALISVLSGSAFLYNAWGPILVVTISFFLVVYACYVLIINDSLLSPHALFLTEYCKQAALNVHDYFNGIVQEAFQYAQKYWQYMEERFRKQSLMERRRGSNYQLSSDNPSSTTINSSGFGLIAEPSPIPRDESFNTNTDFKKELYPESDSPSFDRNSSGKRISASFFTSTLTPNKDNLENEDTEFYSPKRISAKKTSPMYAQKHTLTRGESTTYFSPEGSPWGTSISPKIRSKGGGVKSVQTVAGPLLASTRYNIDPKVYSDVTSPGLTTRLTKYATEANTKLTYQSRYCAGRFPKVNLRANPIPVINANSIKTKMPIPGRVASPNTDRYSSLGKQKILFGSHRTEDRSSSDVARVLKEISLKRHASREEVLSDLAKKQRTDGSIRDEFETSDETKQKRSREDASKSEEEVSPQNRTVRPTKRTKTPSCYDILNSLSSSKHIASGVKRKAIDFSRSGTPDFEKHFKSLECTQSPVETLSESSNVKSDCSEEKITAEIAPKNTDPCEFLSKLQDCTPIKGILKSSMKDSLIDKTDKDTGMNSSGTQNAKGQPAEDFTSTESVKLTDKLFMRAEPLRNEKLRMLIEEQGSIKAKFTTNDAEEIKKEDIVNMRQNSMRARLQSMFDAISGKAANRINPDVVIQAEEVSTEKAVVCPVTCATLNSSTTTTNINTTPISTSAIVPGLSVNESAAKPVKHVAFALPDKQDTSGPSTPITRTTEADNSSAPFVPVTATAKFESTFTAPAAGVAPVAYVASVASVAPVAPVTSVTSDSSNISFGKLSQLSNLAPSPNSNVLTLTGGTTDKANVALTATPETKGESNSNCTTTVFQSTVSALPNSTPNSSYTFRQNNVTPASMVGNAAYGATNIAVTRTQITGIASTACTSMTSSVKTVSSSVSSSGQGAFVTGTSAPLFTFGNKIPTLQSSKFQASGVKLPGSATQSSVSMANTFGNLPNPSASITVENGTTKTISTSSTFGSSMTSLTSPYGSSGSGSSVRDNKPGFSFGIAPTSIASAATGATTDSVTAAATVIAVTAATTTNSGIAITTNGKTVSPFGATTASVGSVPQFGSVGASIFGNTSSTPIFGQTVFGVSSSDGGVSRGFIPSKTTTAPIFASNCHTPSSGLITTNATSVFQNSGPSASASASATASISTAMVSSTSAATIFGSNVNTLIVSSPGMGGGATSNLFTSANVNANINANANSNARGTASGITTTTSGSFGASGSNIFGQTKSPPGGFRTNAGVFGGNGTSLLGSQTTTTPSFGGPAGSSGTTVPSFGSSNANVPTFGTTNAASTTFGTSSGGGALLTGQTSSLQAFGTTSSVFGTAGNATAPSLFGATGTGVFSSGTPNAFAGQSANVGFGGTKSATGFVDNKPSPFGAQSTGVPAFGAPGCSTSGLEPASSTGGNNNSSSVFTFGGNQKQQNATFSFGSGNTGNGTTTAASVSATASGSVSASASTSTSAPFQFGATTSQAATGFNFSAPSTTPSINFASSGTHTFNAPTPGMFSIGSGSTAPRFRSIRTKKTR